MSSPCGCVGCSSLPRQPRVSLHSYDLILGCHVPYHSTSPCAACCSQLCSASTAAPRGACVLPLDQMKALCMSLVTDVWCGRALRAISAVPFLSAPSLPAFGATIAPSCVIKAGGISLESQWEHFQGQPLSGSRHRPGHASGVPRNGSTNDVK